MSLTEILETGNPLAAGGAEESQGPFLINLAEPLCVAGHVSSGRNSADILASGKINTLDPGSRDRNNAARGDNTHTGDILFDQILVSGELADRYVAGSTKVFDGGVAVAGNNNTRASDHLPVSASFTFGVEVVTETAEDRITALFPNPPGDDRGREEVHLTNAGTAAVDVSGWTLVDRAQNQFTLDGTLDAGQVRVLRLPANVLPLNNTGDTVTLLNAAGDEVDQVEYSKQQARTEQLIEFAP